MSNPDRLATEIANDVIEEALRSVERNSHSDSATAPASEPAADPAELRKAREQLLEARQLLRQREAELEASQALARETHEKLREEHERLLRTAADHENSKRRYAREKDELLKFGQEKLLREMLPVLDNLDRALEAAATATDPDALRTGVQMTRRLFEDTLAKFGVKGFSALGAVFDPHLHEAMQAVESDAAPNTVVHELVRGYTLNERLIRPAMVVVARPRTTPAPAPQPAPDSGAGSPAPDREAPSQN